MAVVPLAQGQTLCRPSHHRSNPYMYGLDLLSDTLLRTFQAVPKCKTGTVNRWCMVEKTIAGGDLMTARTNMLPPFPGHETGPGGKRLLPGFPGFEDQKRFLPGFPGFEDHMNLPQPMAPAPGHVTEGEASLVQENRDASHAANTRRNYTGGFRALLRLVPGPGRPGPAG